MCVIRLPDSKYTYDKDFVSYDCIKLLGNLNSKFTGDMFLIHYLRGHLNKSTFLNTQTLEYVHC